MKRVFADIATTIAQQSGRPFTFVLALLVVVAWAAIGPLFHFSDTWQLVINTSTTIITFLMVFVIQNTQNRDGAAIQAKLDELIRVGAARNTLIRMRCSPRMRSRRYAQPVLPKHVAQVAARKKRLTRKPKRR